MNYLRVDESGEWQIVEQVGEILPHVGVAVLAQALVVEAVHLCDLTRLVVAAQYCDAIFVAHLERDKQCHGLHRVVAAIDIVAHEQVVGVRRVAADFEQLHEIVELAVHVAAHRHRTLDLLHVGFGRQYLARLVAQRLHLCL